MAWITKRLSGLTAAPVQRAALVLLLTTAPLTDAAGLSLDQAIAMAQTQDPWLQGSLHRQQALNAMSTAAGTLPDPVMSIGLANLPTDTFDFNQEAMTQFQVGVSQTLPRGNSRALRQQQLTLMGSQQPLLRSDRKAQVAVQVSQLWLETYRARETIRLIEADRELFEHLVDVAESSYSAAMGKARQQDLIRAQLELTRLEDRLSQLHEQLDVARSQLGQWLPTPTYGSIHQWKSATTDLDPLPAELPTLTLANPDLHQRIAQMNLQDIAEIVMDHPAIQTLDTKIEASTTGIRIAEEGLKPEWKVHASYGYRDDVPSGPDRADFFSVGLAFDLPLFTENRQNQHVRSQAATTETVRTERALLLRNMVAAFDMQRSRLLRLEERRTLYKTRLLKETHDQAEASLSAYTTDDGDFAEVVRSRIAELNAGIDALNIEVDRLKTLSQLNYFLAPNQEAGESL